MIPVSPAEMLQPIGWRGTTAAVRDRVLAARERQDKRFDGMPWTVNAAVPAADFRRVCPVSDEVSGAVGDAVAKGHLTQRGADRVVRLAWTLADLGGLDRPGQDQAAEALHLRTNGDAGASYRSAEVA